MIEVISANGTPVRNLQEMLRAIYFASEILPEVIVDGIFDEKTEEAVINFQKKFNLSPTGIVDILTFEKIVEEYGKTIERNEITKQ